MLEVANNIGPVFRKERWESEEGAERKREERKGGGGKGGGDEAGGEGGERNACVQTDFSLPSLFELGPSPWSSAITIAWPMSVIPLVLNLSRKSLTDTPRYLNVTLNPVRLIIKLPYQFHQLKLL